MILKRSLFLIISIIAVSSCKGPQVIYFANPNAEFGEYVTYRIVSPKGGTETAATDTSTLGREIEQLIQTDMEGRGYEYRSKADLRVEYRFIANSKTDIDVTPTYGTRGAVFSPFYPRYPYQTYDVRERSFYEAILLIELRNRAAKIVWQGSLDMKYTKKIKDKRQIIPTAVGKIMDTYPYVAGNSEPVRGLEVKN